MTAHVVRGPWPGITAATKLPSAPPTVEYLAERVRLGIPSLAETLLVACPWCHSRAGEACHVRATGRRLPQPHEARQVAAQDPEATPRLTFVQICTKVSRGPGRWPRLQRRPATGAGGKYCFCHAAHGAVLVRQLVQAETGTSPPPRAAEVAALRAARTLPDSYGLVRSWWRVCRKCLYPQTDRAYWCANPRCGAKYGDLTDLTVVRHAGRPGRLSVAMRRNVWQHIGAAP